CAHSRARAGLDAPPGAAVLVPRPPALARTSVLPPLRRLDPRADARRAPRSESEGARGAPDLVRGALLRDRVGARARPGAPRERARACRCRRRQRPATWVDPGRAPRALARGGDV